MATNDTSAGYLPWTEVEVIFLGMYCTTATVLGIIGNSIVIYSSVRYSAVKLDRISLIFTQHLALADILYILLVVFPRCTTFFAGQYVFGTGYCFLTAQLAVFPGTVNTQQSNCALHHRMQAQEDQLSLLQQSNCALRHRIQAQEDQLSLLQELCLCYPCCGMGGGVDRNRPLTFLPLLRALWSGRCFLCIWHLHGWGHSYFTLKCPGGCCHLLYLQWRSLSRTSYY